jgi:hypothetical protein
MSYDENRISDMIDGGLLQQEIENEAFLNQYYKDAQEYDRETQRRNSRILKAIESQIGKGFTSDLKNLIEECECSSSRLVFVDKPKGDYQEESYHGCITGIWVVQHSQGMEGDSFYGTVTVKLKDCKYLEMPFSV